MSDNNDTRNRREKWKYVSHGFYTVGEVVKYTVKIDEIVTHVCIL